MGGEVRYCTTEDGVRIAYCVEGEGPPLVMTPFFNESFSLHHLVPEVDRLLEPLRSNRRVILYDPRGTGLSQRDAPIDAQSGDLDLQAVARASGNEPAARAEGGEILVADTVLGLCSGKGFLFADRGEFVAKGFEEPVRVYEVRWRDG